MSKPTILITGAKGGLGTYVTQAFLTANANVIGTARNIAPTDFPHPNFTAEPADLSTLQAAQTLIDQIVQKHGTLDGLVHLVGAFAGGKSIAETDDATLTQMLDINLRSAFNVIRAALPHMRRQGSGRIAAIGSIAAIEPQAMSGAYAASKAALVSLIRTTARENRDKSITANIVLPGTMDTPANRAAMPNADPAKWVHPNQVAQLLVHLILGESSQISGAVIPIAGTDA
jgi:NAD(P)-dependent dehydrogenase (short-subunit alcohol dehydrogenase family)